MPAPLYRGMPAGKHGPYLIHKDETNGFCLCGLCGCLIGSGRLFVSLREIRFIFVHYCYKASIKLEYQGFFFFYISTCTAKYISFQNFYMTFMNHVIDTMQCDIYDY